MHKYKTVLFFVTIFFGSCFQIFDEPKTSLVISLQNPGKTKKGVVFQSSGNATVGLSLHVSILSFESKSLGSEVGNTFIVDGNHGATRLDSSSINLKWISNDNLQIKYDKKLRSFLKNSKVNGVKIIYVTN